MIRKQIRNLPPINQDMDISELWDKCIKPLNDNPTAFSYGYKIRMIHLFDAVCRGTINKLEAYDAIDEKYFPAVLETRISAYQHLL